MRHIFWEALWTLTHSYVFTVWCCSGDNQPGGGAGGRGGHVFCWSQEADWRQHSGSRLHHTVSEAAWVFVLPQRLRPRSHSVVVSQRYIRVFAVCTWGKAEERRGSARSTTRPACQKQRPCSPSTPMVSETLRTEPAVRLPSRQTSWRGLRCWTCDPEPSDQTSDCWGQSDLWFDLRLFDTRRSRLGSVVNVLAPAHRSSADVAPQPHGYIGACGLICP